MMNEKAVILVGGLGTRIRHVIGEIPKPMVEINGTPYLEMFLRYLKRSGFARIVLCVGYKGEAIQQYFGDGTILGLQIEYCVEKELLGTAGALKNAQEILCSEEKFFVCNGDSFIDIDFEKMRQLHSMKNAMVTMAITDTDDVARYGEVQVASDNQIVGFSEKNPKSNHRGMINVGVYLCSAGLLAHIPLDRVQSLERDIFPGLVSNNGLYGYIQDGDFIDIGTPEALEYFRNNVTLFSI